MGSATLAERPGRIEMKLRRVSQLLHTLDPSPFWESDLALEAEEYLVGRVLELQKGIPIDIIIYLPAGEFSKASTLDIAGAIRNYFGLRSQAVTRQMRELFKIGRLSLIIGLIVLTACLLLGWLFAQGISEGPLARILSESLLFWLGCDLEAI